MAKSKAKPQASSAVRSRVPADEAGRVLSDAVVAARRNPTRANMRPIEYARWCLASYQRTLNGWHVVNAYLALHRAGHPIPRNMLNWLADAFERMEHGESDPLQLSQTRAKAQRQLSRFMMLGSIETVLKHVDQATVTRFTERSYSERVAEMQTRRKQGLKPQRKPRSAKAAPVVRAAALDFGMSPDTARDAWKEHKRRTRGK